MATTLIDSFSLNAKQFLDNRQCMATLAELRSISDTSVPDGFRAYCAETLRWYEYTSTNEPDAKLGRWREADGVAQSVIDGINAELTALRSSVAKMAPQSAIYPISGYRVVESAIPTDGIWFNVSTCKFEFYGTSATADKTLYNSGESGTGTARADVLFQLGGALFRYNAAVSDLVQVTSGTAGDASFVWTPSTATLEIFTEQSN